MRLQKCFGKERVYTWASGKWRQVGKPVEGNEQNSRMFWLSLSRDTVTHAVRRWAWNRSNRLMDIIQVRGGGDMDLDLDGGREEKGQIMEILWTIKFNNGSNTDKSRVRLTPSFLAEVTRRVELTFTQKRKTPEEQGFVRQSKWQL